MQLPVDQLEGDSESARGTDLFEEQLLPNLLEQALYLGVEEHEEARQQGSIRRASFRNRKAKQNHIYFGALRCRQRAVCSMKYTNLFGTTQVLLVKRANHG